MKVSIIIPAYNEELFLAATIRAALAQDHDDFEVIVVDNASTDKTSEVAKQFPIKVVREDRKGLLWARECGRVAAQGSIIANIDADCLPETDWLTRGLQHFSHDPAGNTAAVTGPYDYHDAKRSFRASSLLTQKYIYRPVSYVIQLPFIRFGAILIGGNNMIRADVLRMAGGYNTDLVFYGEDTDTANRVSNHGRVIFDSNLQMKTSARRFKNEGIISIESKYIYHFLKTILGSKKTSK